MIITNLLSNMVVLTMWGGIPTNTLAFQDYAFQVMLSSAQVIASKWHLEQALISSNNVTAFSATAYPEGFTASIVFGDRYIFGTERGDCIGFTDKSYYKGWAFATTNVEALSQRNLQRTGTNTERLWHIAAEADEQLHWALAKKWSAATNLLTFKKARALAQSAVRAMGVPMKLARMKPSPKGEQMVWDEPPMHAWLPADAVATNSHDYVTKVRGIPKIGSGPVTVIGPFEDGGWYVSYPRDHTAKYVLPYYEFRWPRPEAPEFEVCEVHVSGISSNIVHFVYYGPGLERPLPPNYLQLLGLPRDTMFVKRRFSTPTTYEPYAP